MFIYSETNFPLMSLLLDMHTYGHIDKKACKKIETVKYKRAHLTEQAHRPADGPSPLPDRYNKSDSRKKNRV